MRFIKLFETDIDFYSLYSEINLFSIPLFIVSNKETKELGQIIINNSGGIDDKSRDILRDDLFFYVNKITTEIDIKDVTIYYYYEKFADDDTPSIKNKSNIISNFLLTDSKTKGWWMRFISNATISSIDLSIQDIEEFKNSKERFMIVLNNHKTDYSKF